MQELLYAQNIENNMSVQACHKCEGLKMRSLKNTLEYLLIYSPMESLAAGIKCIAKRFDNIKYFLVAMCQIAHSALAIPTKTLVAKVIAKALSHRVIWISGCSTFTIDM